MSGEWHDGMQKKFEQYGKDLGFKAKTEVRIPKGSIDCIWELKEPISEYFVAFEFETATTGSQIVENLVKVLSIAPQMRPRFLVQIYRNKLKDKDREFIEKISNTLPVAAKIIDNVRDDVEEASLAVIRDLFNWIGEYAEMPIEFLTRLEKIIPKQNIVRVFHYGEPSRSHLSYLDDALRYPKDYLLWLKSISAAEDKNLISNEFRCLAKYDVVVISDVSPKKCDMPSLQEFLENEVKRNGKTMILTGGLGLTAEYNDLGEENLGGRVGGPSNKVVKIVKSKDYIGVGLTFKGFNKFKPIDTDEIIAHWNISDFPALIVHNVGKGKVIIFTSDCSPAWGTPSIKTEGFKEMGKHIIEKYCNIGREVKTTI